MMMMMMARNEQPTSIWWSHRVSPASSFQIPVSLAIGLFLFHCAGTNSADIFPYNVSLRLKISDPAGLPVGGCVPTHFYPLSFWNPLLR